MAAVSQTKMIEAPEPQVNANTRVVRGTGGWRECQRTDMPAADLARSIGRQELSREVVFIVAALAVRVNTSRATWVGMVVVVVVVVVVMVLQREDQSERPCCNSLQERRKSQVPPQWTQTSALPPPHSIGMPLWRVGPPPPLFSLPRRFYVSLIIRHTTHGLCRNEMAVQGSRSTRPFGSALARSVVALLARVEMCACGAAVL